MREGILIIISLLSVTGVFLIPAIPQDVLYHQFADQQQFFGIPNFNDVISNLPYLLIGIAGIRLLNSRQSVQLLDSIRYVYQLFFIGIALIGLGSAYYHLAPDNSTLLWDRLPMAVTFMSFFTIVIGEFISEKKARQLFAILLISGLVSVLYWHWSESIGAGDLRAYILVQFLPVLLMPLIFLMYRPSFTHRHFFWWVLVCYAVAKGLELFDFEVYQYLGWVSGHTLKHLVSAIAPVLVYLALVKRKRLVGDEGTKEV